MIIREAKTGDAQALSELAMETYTEAFWHSLTPSDLAAHLERNLSSKSFERILDEDTVLVAEADDRMVGFVQFGRTDLGTEAVSNNDQELRRLYVHADFQNKGIGTRLMDTALNHPGLQGAERIFLDVWEHNHGAQRFYARYGFEVIGERKFLVESGAETSQDSIMVHRRAAPEHRMTTDTARPRLAIPNSHAERCS